MDQDRHALSSLAVVAEALLGPCPPQRHRPHELQVRWVGRERQANRISRFGDVIAAVAAVILHIAAAGNEILRPRFGKLGEDLVVRLVQDVHQHVEPAAVGHADGELLHIVDRPLLDDLIEQRDDRLTTIDAEPLRPGIAGVNEVLERIGFG